MLHVDRITLIELIDNVSFLVAKIQLKNILFMSFTFGIIGSTYVNMHVYGRYICNIMSKSYGLTDK